MKTCPKCDHANPDGVSFCEECGVMLPLGENEADPILGSLLVDKFRIKELIGQGAMGRVYSATQEPINRQVAVKILHQHLLEDRRVARRFQREAEAASRFSHPNSIGIFDFGQTKDGALYIAMEYIVGTDLADVIARQAPLSPERTVRVATQVLSALHLAHASKIIHRDLKPENIMLSDLPGHKDFVKVCDFGIAKIQQQPGANGQESALTMFGMICGTPYYMSPEQAKGEELDGRSDLYSMGVILYEMLTGEVPFRGSTPVEVIARHLTDPPLPPSKLLPEQRIPRALEDVVLRALSKKREERFADAQSFAEELEKALKEAEFQADLERVLQQAQSTPAQSNTPANQLEATQVAKQPQAVVGGGPAAFHAPMGQPSSPPIAAPKGPAIATPKGPAIARPISQGNVPHKTPAPGLSSRSSGPLAPVSAPPSGDLSRNTPVPSLRPSLQQDPPVLLTSSLDDFEPEPPRNKAPMIFLIILLVGAGIVGYMWYSNNQKRLKDGVSKKQTTIRGYADGMDPAKKSKQNTKGSSQAATRRPVVKRPTRRRRHRRRRRRRRRYARASKQQRAHKRRFKKLFNEFVRWKRSYQFYLDDLGAQAKRLYHRATRAAGRNHYDQAAQYVIDLKEHIGVSYNKVPVKIISQKYSLLNEKYKRIKNKMKPAEQKRVDALFGQAVNARFSNNYKQLNKLTSRARTIINRYK